MSDLITGKKIKLKAKNIRVKLLYRNFESNFLWKEYDVDFPELDCTVTEFGEVYLNNSNEAINIIKNFLIEEEMQKINMIFLPSRYIGTLKEIKIVGDVITSKHVIRQLRIDEL